MTAFGRAFRTTEREKLSLRWKFRILEKKLIFMDKMLGDQILGVERNRNQKSINSAIYQNHFGVRSNHSTIVVCTKFEQKPSS